jgi:hypothetical protein
MKIFDAVVSRRIDILTASYRKVAVMEEFIDAVKASQALRAPANLVSTAKVAGGTAALQLARNAGEGSQLLPFLRLGIQLGDGGGVTPGGLSIVVTAENRDGVDLSTTLTCWMRDRSASIFIMLGAVSEGQYYAQPSYVAYDAVTPITLDVAVTSTMGDDVTLVLDAITPGSPDFAKLVGQLTAGYQQRYTEALDDIDNNYTFIPDLIERQEFKMLVEGQ